MVKGVHSAWYNVGTLYSSSGACHVGYSLEVDIFSQNDGDFVNAPKG